jgi:S1-C subfamily serine protease
MRALLAFLLLSSTASADVTMVAFGHDACPPCVQSRPMVARLERTYAVSHVDRDKQPGMVTRFDVTRYPTFVLLSDGKEIDRITGYDNRTEARLTERLSGSHRWRPRRSTVRIRSTHGGFADSGTGTILSSSPGDTIVLTCAHVLRDAEKITVEVFRDEAPETYSATVAALETDSDLALLKITSNRQCLPTTHAADPISIKAGETVYSVGCSHAEAPTVVVAKVIRLNQFDGAENILCSDVPLQGRSGGGLFNRRFALIGICSAVSRGQGIYVHANEAKTLLARRPTQYRYPPAGIGFGVGVCVGTSCNNSTCPCRRTAGKTGAQGPRGYTGATGPRGAQGFPGAPGRDATGTSIAALVKRIEALETAKRRVLLVDGDTKEVIDDESYGIDEPMVFDVQSLLRAAK